MDVEKCISCPVLKAARQMSRLAGIGLEYDADSALFSCVIGQLREEHGCPGPRQGRCHWMRGLVAGFRFSDDVPLLKGSRKNTGQYL